jgi:putative transposase
MRWQRLAYWRGNVVAVHRELVDTAAAGGPAAPSLAALYRAVNRQLSPGDQAGSGKSRHAARAHDLFLQRPPAHRNEA